MLIENPAKNNRYVVVRYAGSNLANPGPGRIYVSFGSNICEEAIDALSTLEDHISGVLYDRKIGAFLFTHPSNTDGTPRGAAASSGAAAVVGAATGWGVISSIEWGAASLGTATLGPAGTILGWTLGATVAGWTFAQGRGDGTQVNRLEAWTRENVSRIE